jgi:hypothetical protein
MRLTSDGLPAYRPPTRQPEYSTITLWIDIAGHRRMQMVSRNGGIAMPFHPIQNREVSSSQLPMPPVDRFSR